MRRVILPRLVRTRVLIVPSAAAVRLVVALVDDYELVRLGLRQIFSSCSDRLVLVDLDENDVNRSVELVDVVLIDADTTLASDQKKIQRLIGNPRIRHVVVFRWTFDAASVEMGLRLGAHGFVSKALPAIDLAAALEDVEDDELVIKGLAPASTPAALSRDRGRAAGLSTREAEVLGLIMEGLNNVEIAAATHLTANTVKSYIRSLYRKIGVSTRAQALRWALTNSY